MVVKFYCNYCGHIPGIGKSDLTSRNTLSVIDDCGCRDSRLRNDLSTSSEQEVDFRLRENRDGCASPSRSPLAILSSSGWCAHGHSWSRVRARLRAVHGDDPHGTSRNSGCSVASDGDGSHHSREQPQVQPAAEWNRRRHGCQHYFDQVLDLRGCLVGWFSCSGRIDLPRNTTATCSTQMPCTIEQMRSLPL